MMEDTGSGERASWVAHRRSGAENMIGASIPATCKRITGSSSGRLWRLGKTGVTGLTALVLAAGTIGCETKAGTGALIGGGAGAGIGAIIGHNSHGRTAEGALIGGAAGAIG